MICEAKLASVLAMTRSAPTIPAELVGFLRAAREDDHVVTTLGRAPSEEGTDLSGSAGKDDLHRGVILVQSGEELDRTTSMPSFA